MTLSAWLQACCCMRSSTPGHSLESDRSRVHQGGAGLLADGNILQAWRPVGKDKGARQLSVARRRATRGRQVVAEPCMPGRLTMVLVVARARGGGQCGGSRWSSAERRDATDEHAEGGGRGGRAAASPGGARRLRTVSGLCTSAAHSPQRRSNGKKRRIRVMCRESGRKERIQRGVA
jgi:hypothetical protein